MAGVKHEFPDVKKNNQSKRILLIKFQILKYGYHVSNF